MWVKVVLPKLKKKLKKHKENNPDQWTLKLMSLLCKSDFTNTVSLFVVCVYTVFFDVLIFGTCADEIWCLHVVGYTNVTSSVCPCWQQLADSSRLHRPCILFLPVMSWPSSLQRAIRTNETSVRRSTLSSQIKWVREKVKEKANAMESKPCCWQKAVFSFNSCTCKSGFSIVAINTTSLAVLFHIGITEVWYQRSTLLCLVMFLFFYHPCSSVFHALIDGLVPGWWAELLTNM